MLLSMIPTVLCANSQPEQPSQPSIEQDDSAVRTGFSTSKKLAHLMEVERADAIKALTHRTEEIERMRSSKEMKACLLEAAGNAYKKRIQNIERMSIFVLQQKAQQIVQSGK